MIADGNFKFNPLPNVYSQLYTLHGFVNGEAHCCSILLLPNQSLVRAKARREVDETTDASIEQERLQLAGHIQANGGFATDASH
ncbi:MAG: hypothetical protein GY820_01770 [Gammaproteobacteria bacterium]|nr:hypothetical protein [Gammaproteobacteria bacterium]